MLTLTRGFLMSLRRWGVRPLFFSTALEMARGPSISVSATGGCNGCAAYLSCRLQHVRSSWDSPRPQSCRQHSTSAAAYDAVRAKGT